jgi:hypothetical protein
MPNPNAFVSAVVQISPPLERPAAEVLRGTEGGVSVEFENERTARLNPEDGRSPGFAEILEGLRRIRMPAYVEVNDAGFVTLLLIPLVVKVTNFNETAAGDLSVELEISHSRHVLRRDNPDFEELFDALRNARERDSWVAVTETHEHEIIDVTPYALPFEPERRGPLKESQLRRFFCRLWCWPCRFLCWLCCRRCVSARRAQELFDLVAAQTCDPLNVPAPCIPFLYPDDGCWGRAHEMCRLMIAAGASPKKVWIYYSGPFLHVNTKNNPQCFVEWGWHVAPTLCVRVGGRFFCRTEDRGIDPALFQTPVSKATWKGVQNDPAATLVDTDASIFYRSPGGSTQTDPNYVQTAQVLATYRLQLKNRSLQLGPPPYANCP